MANEIRWPFFLIEKNGKTVVTKFRL